MRWTFDRYKRLKGNKQEPNDRLWQRYGQLVAGDKEKSRVRVWPFLAMVIVVMVVLSGRVFQLTVVEGTYHRERSDGNRFLSVRLGAERGILFDRNGVPLVHNVPAYKRQVQGTTLKQGLFEPITREVALAYGHDQGQRVYFDVRRVYDCGRPCAGVIGYINEIDAGELENMGSGYVMGDLVGKAGLERVYEWELRGRPGSEVVEVDARGQMVRLISEETSKPGQDLKLTLDMELQKYIYDLMEGMIGSVVVQKPQTGEVLALVSWPSFNPADVAGSLAEPHQPFYNRALQAAYPPGSVFKMVPSIAALEEGRVTANTMIEDTGVIMIDEFRFGNWLWLEHGRTDGMVDVVKALQRSNDIYYYRVGGMLGAEKIAEWARIFGFGEAWSISGLRSVSGVVPDPRWKERTRGERWFLGNTYHYAIGQGDLTVTPLQVNVMIGALANDGVLCPPILLEREVGQDSCRQLNLQADYLKLVHEGMVKACEPGGTGAPFFDIGGEVACKTGTAQHEARTLPHAWFTLYAPADNPELAVTVMMERAGQGSEVAGPVAREIWEWWKERH